jgi:hypothetical protein
MGKEPNVVQPTSPFSPSAAPGRRGSALVFPLLLVVVGIILLLNNLGIIPWAIWIALADLWPVVLILVGIELLIARRAPRVGGAIAAIVLVATFALAGWLTLTQNQQVISTGPLQNQTVSVPRENATTGQVSLKFPVGVLTVAAQPASGTPGPDLIEASAALPPGLHLSTHVGPPGDVAGADLTVDGNGNVWPFGSPFGKNPMSLDARLTPAVPLTIDSEVGAGQSTFDLSNLLVRSFTLKSGAGQVTIDLPRAAGQSIVDLQSGAGEVTIVAPPGVGVYLHTKNGLGLAGVQVPPGRYEKVADGLQSSDYATAENRVDVTLHLGIGQVDVR